MPRGKFPYHLVILVLFMGAVVGGTLCQAKSLDASNISRTIPVDLFGREKASIEKYKEFYGEKVDHFPTVNPPSQFQTTPTLTPVPTLTTALRVNQTPVPIQTDITSNATGSPLSNIRGTLAQNLVFSTLLIFVLIGGGILLHLILLLRDIHGPVGPYPWWHPVRRIFLGAHALMAAFFFIEAMVFIGSLLLWNAFSGQGVILIIVGGFLLGYGAISSVGMAYSSFEGRVLKWASLGHILLTASGAMVSIALGRITILPFSTLVSIALGRITILPFSPIIPACTFLISLCIVLLQVWKPRKSAGEQAVTLTDTMLFEEKPTPFTPPFPPELEQRYYGARFLHQGGIARVFSARRRDDGVVVAVKVPIKTDEQTGRSLLREMGVWRTLTHPGIVQVNAANILPVPYVEMEYLPESLSDVPLPMQPCDAAQIIRKIANALAFAHDRGVIHRDLKPGNILLSSEGEPKIGDWGLSRNDSTPAETTLHGFSLSYAAPEQLDPGRFGRTTNKTDIYQLGIIFYQLLTGVLPFPGVSIAEMTRERLDGSIRAPSVLTPSAGVFDAIIRGCVATDPADRYCTIRDLLSDLDTCIDEVCGPSKEHKEPGGGGGDDPT